VTIELSDAGLWLWVILLPCVVIDVGQAVAEYLLKVWEVRLGIVSLQVRSATPRWPFRWGPFGGPRVTRLSALGGGVEIHYFKEDVDGLEVRLDSARTADEAEVLTGFRIELTRRKTCD
jgi:hypothetical protein